MSTSQICGGGRGPPVVGLDGGYARWHARMRERAGPDSCAEEHERGANTSGVSTSGGGDGGCSGSRSRARCFEWWS